MIIHVSPKMVLVLKFRWKISPQQPISVAPGAAYPLPVPQFHPHMPSHTPEWTALASSRAGSPIAITRQYPDAASTGATYTVLRDSEALARKPRRTPARINMQQVTEPFKVYHSKHDKKCKHGQCDIHPTLTPRCVPKPSIF